MKSKTILALICVAVITIGSNMGSYAWFTDSSSSTVNILKAGTLGISTNSNIVPISETFDDKSFSENSDQLQVNDLKSGDIFCFTYTINNLTNGQPSTLDLYYKNTILDNYNSEDSILRVCKFKLSITDENSSSIVSTENDIDYLTLKEYIEGTQTNPVETLLSGGAVHSRNYTITIMVPADIPEDTLLGKSSFFQIISYARQVNGQY